MNVKRIVCGLGAAATMGTVGLVGLGAPNAWAATCPAFPYAAAEPTLTTSTDAPSAGQIILVSGCGFTPNATVSVFLLSRHLFVGNVVVKANGGFDIRVKIPDFFCGPHRVAAFQQNPRKEARALIVVFDCHGRNRADSGVPQQHQAPQPSPKAGGAAGGAGGAGGAGVRGYTLQSDSRDLRDSTSTLPAGAEAFGIAAVGAAVLGGGVRVAARRRRAGER